MNSNLHPIFQQELKPFAPRSHGDVNDSAAKELFNNEAFLAECDRAVDALKALPMEQTPAYNRALEKQMTAHLRSGSLI